MYKFFSFLLLVVLCGCANTKRPEEAPESREDKAKLGFGSLAGPEGITFGNDKVAGRTDGGGGNVVNRYLWRASLNVVKFAPLVSSDGPGGMLVTDWYQSPGASDRLKIQVSIKDRQLHSNALEVSVYKRVLKNGNWCDVGIDAKASRELENIILREARNIRANEK